MIEFQWRSFNPKKMILWKCCTQHASKSGKWQWPQDWKRSVFIPISKKGNARECSNYHTIAFISHTSKVMFKILQARLQQYVNHKLPDIQAGFRKGRGTRDQIANIHWIIEKARKFQKKSTSSLLIMPKPLTVWITTNCGKFLKRWEYKTISPASWETCMEVKKQQIEPDMEQWTGSKFEKEYIKAVKCHYAYLTYRQSTSCEILGWMKHKLESRLAGENINNLRYADDTTLIVIKWRGTKDSLDESERGEWNSWFKTQHSKHKDHGIGPITSWEIDGKMMEMVTGFIFLGTKITTDGDCSHEIKRCLLLGRKVMTKLNSILKSRDITLLTKSI